ncbi:MAG: peptidylprolyl isomerase [Balneolaceae bacterium]
MTKYLLSCFLIFVLLLPIDIFAQSKNDKTVVGTVGKEKVTYAEVKNNFSSGSSTSVSLDELESFLPLYLDYKAKLVSAKENGYYNDSTLVAEHEQYAKQAAYAYWLEKEIRPAVFETYYQRANTELKAFHILIKTSSNSSPEEIEKVKEKLYEATKEIENGVPLDEINEKYSSVQNGRSMGGNLPWLSAGRTVKEFEDHVFDLEAGEISEPFATQFGYHIVLLQFKRERTPARLTNHIFIRPSQDSAAYKKAHEAYGHLEQGQNWNQVMQQYSEDNASKGNNGSIGWVSYSSNFASDFVDAVTQIDSDLDYSEPIRTNYGYHIFKIDSVQTYSSEDERKQEVMEELKKSNYYKENNAFVLDYLQKKFGVLEYSDALNAYKNHITDFDSTRISEISLPSSLSSQEIFEFNGTASTVEDFHTYLVSLKPLRARQFKSNLFTDFKHHIVDLQVIDLTLSNYPQFKEQSESYLNGLVVYQINDDFVWNAATVDTTKLMEIYENNAETYRYEARPYFYLINARHDSTLNKTIDFVKSGNSPDSIRVYHNNVSVSSDSTSSYTEEPFSMLNDMEPGSFSTIFDYNKRKAVFYLKEKLPARKMTFEEAFNRLMAEFQPEREQAWLQEIRSKFKVKPKLKNLRKAYQKDPESSK